MKKSLIACIAAAGLSGLLFAQEPIDLTNYRVKIIKNASQKSIEKEIKSAKFEFGGDLEKIIEKVDFDCKSLGLAKTDEFKNPAMGYVEYTYKKEIEKDIEALCEEKVFNDGSNSVALLVVW